MIPFFKNSIKNTDKNLSDPQVVKDLKIDIDAIAFNIQKLPFMIKMGVNMMGITSSISNIRSSLNGITNGNNVENNTQSLKNNFKALDAKFKNNKQYEKALKSYLGNDYLKVFDSVNSMVNKSN